MLRSYEAPLAKAAGLDPAAVKLYLVGDTGVNAFVAEGQNMFRPLRHYPLCENPE